MEPTLSEDQLLRKIIDSLPDLIYVKDRQGRNILNNLAHARFLGFDRPQHLVGKTVFDYFPHELAQPFHEDEQKVMQSGVSLVDREERSTDRNGRALWVSTTKVPLRDGEGVVAGLIGITRDITDRKHYEEALERANHDLAENRRSLLEAMALLKQSHEDLIQAQLQLIQAEKMDSVGRLAAGVAHEVKNPLAVLLMGVEYLTTVSPRSDQDAREVLRAMRDAVTRADKIVRGLVDFSAARQLETSPHPINSLVESALTLVKHELLANRIASQLELGEKLPLVSVDETKIVQVLVNVFLNAIHAMPGGGTLRVHTYAAQATSHQDDGSRRGAAFHAGDEAVFVQIEDTGTGIAPDKLASIFDPFFTTKPPGQGTGLGLTVSRKIIELHGGLIALKNRPEKGAAVTIQLRAMPAAQ